MQRTILFFTKMKKAIYLIPFIFLLFNYPVFPQDETVPESEKDLSSDARFYYENENYLIALKLYLLLDEKRPKIEYKYKICSCYLYKTDEKEK